MYWRHLTDTEGLVEQVFDWDGGVNAVQSGNVADSTNQADLVFLVPRFKGG